ncbi:hypothetical protein M422DRAFT_47761 [Sphaerobolus stellatus SS14]|uniref:C2H2-type domain-containing protein n=1 Tax=Sphaerobolus stellatus (strain SS14) TaxID=990650 RepID=A0A0C9VXP1_SPHS4|nr:hypothetical protein M422DRAFT_47761 [Sphaerobolus stellatus SS14]
MGFVCNSCSKVFQSPRGLKFHESRCEASKKEAQLVLITRRPRIGFRRKRLDSGEAAHKEPHLDENIERGVGMMEDSECSRREGSSSSLHHDCAFGEHADNQQHANPLGDGEVIIGDLYGGDGGEIDMVRMDLGAEKEEEYESQTDALMTMALVPPNAPDILSSLRADLPTDESESLGSTGSRPRRTCQVPSRRPQTIADILPTPSSTLLDDVEEDVDDFGDVASDPLLPPQHELPNPILALEPMQRPQKLLQVLETKPNQFGVYRRYEYRPTHDPDGLERQSVGLGTGSQAAGTHMHPDSAHSHPMELLDISRASHFPFPNESTFKLSAWYYNPETRGRSTSDFDGLCRVVSDPAFKPADIIGFNTTKRNKILDRLTYDEDEAGNEIIPLSGWRRNVEVPIQIPEGKKNWTTSDGQTYSVPGLHHKSITEIVRIWFETKEQLHYTPFETWWKPAINLPPTRIYSELSS